MFINFDRIADQVEELEKSNSFWLRQAASWLSMAAMRIDEGRDPLNCIKQAIQCVSHHNNGMR